MVKILKHSKVLVSLHSIYLSIADKLTADQTKHMTALVAVDNVSHSHEVKQLRWLLTLQWSMVCILTKMAFPGLSLECTHSLTMMQLGLPTVHRFTFLSSPPVTITRPVLCPRARQFTLEPWATNSSAVKIKVSQTI